jgi:hypothetical protein
MIVMIVMGVTGVTIVKTIKTPGGRLSGVFIGNPCRNGRAFPERYSLALFMGTLLIRAGQTTA